jgi:hypothetical protein
MKQGDLVRFRHPNPEGPPQTRLGLLVEYHTWEKIAKIMPIPYDGKIVSVHASEVQKAGRKDTQIMNNREDIK